MKSLQEVLNEGFFDDIIKKLTTPIGEPYEIDSKEKVDARLVDLDKNKKKKAIEYLNWQPLSKVMKSNRNGVITLPKTKLGWDIIMDNKNDREYDVLNWDNKKENFLINVQRISTTTLSQEPGIFLSFDFNPEDSHTFQDTLFYATQDIESKDNINFKKEFIDGIKVRPSLETARDLTYKHNTPTKTFKSYKDTNRG